MGVLIIKQVRGENYAAKINGRRQRNTTKLNKA